MQGDGESGGCVGRLKDRREGGSSLVLETASQSGTQRLGIRSESEWSKACAPKGREEGLGMPGDGAQLSHHTGWLELDRWALTNSKCIGLSRCDSSCVEHFILHWSMPFRGGPIHPYTCDNVKKCNTM